MQARAATLAAAARRLNSEGGEKAARAPFFLAFLTDPRGPDPLLVASVLPRGTALVFRDYDSAGRAARARALSTLCAGRGVLFLVGAEAGLAADVGAAGVHLRSDQLRTPPATARGLVVTAACHDAGDLALAASVGADAAFLSPVFETQSHPGAKTLGADEFKRLAEAAALPVLALGGVDETGAALLAGANVAGFGAIGAFAPRR